MENFFVIVIIISCLLDSIMCAPRTDIVARQCRDETLKTSYEDYIKRYENMTDSMDIEMYRNKHSFHQNSDDDHDGGGLHNNGSSSERLYAFAQCMDDLSGEDCRLCFSQISNLLPGCFPATGGRVYLDGCFMRIENYSFLNESVTVDDAKSCNPMTDDRKEHKEVAKELITKLKQKAQSSTQGYAEHEKIVNHVTVYGIATCWKTLNNNLCDSCLEKAARSAIDCLPSTEGRVLNCGCYLRFSDYNFLNNPESRKIQDEVMKDISYVVGAIAVCSLAILTGFFIGKITFRRHHYQNHKRKETDKEMGSILNKRRLPFLQFKYSTLEKATESFNATHKLGEGGFGEVFKGTLPDGREIAIKRLFSTGKFQSLEIYNEMDVINRAKHKNLVIFLGCCFDNTNSLLVYEYLANKSLDRTLFDPEKKKELDWNKRIGILLGTAKGLEYLHKDCQIRIIHRDIKASNILLDVRYKPKIADFGLARFNSCDQSVMNVAVAGTLGYMAPEYLAQGRLTEKVDVYSYGVLVLEIVSGVQSTKFQSEEALNTLVTTAWRRYQANTEAEIIDKCLEVDKVEEIMRVIQVGLLCTQESPSLRPTMTKVLQMLQQNDTELPEPTKPPFINESFDSCSSQKSSLRIHSLLSDSDKGPQHLQR